MRKSYNSSDSTCDLSYELLKKYDIKTVAFVYKSCGISYHDKVDITVPEMYEKLGIVKVFQNFPLLLQQIFMIF
jgi:fatty acid-binding protein DegV